MPLSPSTALLAFSLLTTVALAAAAASPPSSRPASMKAIRIHEFGGPEVLKYEDAPRPSPGEVEMLVRVYAAAVNPVDAGIRRGGMRRGGRAAMPIIPGFDLSGVVEELGPGVTRFKPGDAVFAFLDLTRGGAYAEYAIVRDAEAAPKPASLSFTEAAAVPLTALTAWQALFDTAKLQPGQTVLVHGGTGGVGTMAVQLAKWKGAKVIATGSAKNQDLLQQLGVDRPVDYEHEKFEDIAHDVDVVLDTVGRDTRDRSWAVLKKGGILVSIVGPPSRSAAAAHGVRAAGILVHPDSAELEQIGKLIDQGKLKPIVSQTYPLSEAAKAQEQIETHHTRGKLVLKVRDK